MKISLNQWNMICEALEIAEVVEHQRAKTLRSDGKPSDAFKVEGKAENFGRLRISILSSDAR